MRSLVKSKTWVEEFTLRVHLKFPKASCTATKQCFDTEVFSEFFCSNGTAPWNVRTLKQHRNLESTYFNNFKPHKMIASNKKTKNSAFFFPQKPSLGHTRSII